MVALLGCVTDVTVYERSWTVPWKVLNEQEREINLFQHPPFWAEVTALRAARLFDASLREEAGRQSAVG